MTPRLVIFMGAPGSGKGTQCERLQDQYLNIIHLSTGNMLRQLDPETELGKKIKAIIASGQLVPDELVNELVYANIMNVDSKWILLDGFPRTQSQAAFLDKKRLDIEKVVFFDIAFEEIERRIETRLTCPVCHRVYNSKTLPPISPGICDVCGQLLAHRSDDSAEKARVRYDIFLKELAPLKEHYKNKWHVINANQDPEKLLKELQNIVA